MCIRKGPTLSILESENNHFLKKMVKIFDFRILIDSDRKKAEIFYGIYWYLKAHFVLEQKHTD